LHTSSDWHALFFAGATPLFLPFYLRYPSYLYVDFSVSRMRELRPWYDEIVDRPPVTAWLRKLSTGIAFRATRGVFAMSRWVADSLEHDFHLSPDRVHVVLPGANLKRWHHVDRSGRPANAPARILFVGAEFGRKGGDLLLDWAERTPNKNWQLDLVTSASSLPEWVRQLLPTASGQRVVSASLAPRLPGVRVHCGLGPNDPELMQLYRDADIFCLPTRADSSSVASLEAMATGLPVLVSAVGGIPELIQSGETGILLRPNDPADLAAKLEAVLDQPQLRHNLGRAARQACERFFNVDRQIREITETIARDRARDRR
jgi:glycosyltransferase involved in cell wall biosynthesis